jgi:hypothetical protein
MKTYYFNILYIIVFISSFQNNKLFSQSTDNNFAINTKITYVNSLINQYNTQVLSLENYQNKVVFFIENQSETSVSKFTLSPINVKSSSLPSNAPDALFNHEYQLKKLENLLTQANEINANISKINFNKTNTAILNEQISQLNILFKKSNELSFQIAETCYDFSRACAINFPAKEFETALGNIKNTAAQSKNIILALRQSSISLAQEYLGLLNTSLENHKDVSKNKTLQNQLDLSIEDIMIKNETIYQNASNIQNITERFLQKKTNDEIALREASILFNAPNGIAENFNHFIKHSGSNYLLFTKEPYLNALYTIAQIDETITEQKVIEKEVFDEKNVHSLAGSLPNHLILLLDVSVSMKKSGNLDLLKNSISHFANIMRADDKLSIIAYSGEAKVLFSGVGMKDKDVVIDSLSKMKSSGGADIYQALRLAYSQGEKHFIKMEIIKL